MFDIGRWSDILRGSVALVLAKGARGLSHWNPDGGRLTFSQQPGRGEVDPFMLFEGYGGNRATVNGFLMNIKRASVLFETGVRIAFDIDIVGNSTIIYDIARERVIKEGVRRVRLELRNAMVMGLKELGIFENLARETQLVLTSQPLPFSIIRPKALVKDEELLNKVAALIPEGRWPWRLHQQIAQELNISGNLASRTIATLLEMGRVRHSTEEQR